MAAAAAEVATEMRVVPDDRPGGQLGFGLLSPLPGTLVGDGEIVISRERERESSAGPRDQCHMINTRWPETNVENS